MNLETSDPTTAYTSRQWKTCSVFKKATAAYIATQNTDYVQILNIEFEG